MLQLSKVISVGFSMGGNLITKVTFPFPDTSLNISSSLEKSSHGAMPRIRIMDKKLKKKKDRKDRKII